jgi:hypothetical protein
MSTNDSAVRLATLMTTVMNLAPLLVDEAAGGGCDPADLRTTLLEVAEEMDWVGSLVGKGMAGGIQWPADASQRIERLRAVAAAWDPLGPLPGDVREAARGCLGILQPGLA